MNGWIVAMIMGLLLVGVIGAGVVFAKDSKLATTAKCGSGSCTGTCTAESNCGSASCGASNGGTCTCGNTEKTCNGSCTAGNTCSSSTCGAKTGSTCGCGKS